MVKSCARAIPLIAAITAFGFAPSAHAAMNASVALVNGENVVLVTGDDGVNRLRVVDGTTSGSPYSARLIDEDGGTIVAGGSCSTVSGSTYCGNGTQHKILIGLAGGADEVIGGGFSFSVLQALTANLGPGNDKTSGQWIGLPVTLNGGDGDDHLFGDVANDTLNGDAGNDELLGATGNDTIHGGDGNDQANGGGNDDQVFGDAGNDSVNGSGDSDTLDGGPGVDSVDGDGGVISQGNDRINVDDGEQDTVSCGPGGDIVTADQLDVIGSDECESVTRSGTGPPPPLPSNDFSIARLVASAKTGTVTITFNVASAGKLALVATAKVPAGLAARTKKITVAKRTVTAAAPGLVRVKLKPSRAAMKILRLKHKLKASLVIRYTPTGGTTAAAKGPVTFKLARKR